MFIEEAQHFSSHVFILYMIHPMTLMRTKVLSYHVMGLGHDVNLRSSYDTELNNQPSSHKLSIKTTKRTPQAPAQMSQSYLCKDNICYTLRQSHLENHGEAIEHIQRYHHQFFIKRPNELGVPDSHGNYWYCFYSKCSYKKSGKDY